MSENLTAFLNLVATDPALRARVAAAGGSAAEETLTRLTAITAELGLPIDPEEFRTLRQKTTPADQELTADDLAGISGGNGPFRGLPGDFLPFPLGNIMPDGTLLRPI